MHKFFQKTITEIYKLKFLQERSVQSKIKQSKANKFITAVAPG